MSVSVFIHNYYCGYVYWGEPEQAPRTLIKSTGTLSIHLLYGSFCKWCIQFVLHEKKS